MGPNFLETIQEYLKDDNNYNNTNSLNGTTNIGGSVDDARYNISLNSREEDIFEAESQPFHHLTSSTGNSSYQASQLGFSYCYPYHGSQSTYHGGQRSVGYADDSHISNAKPSSRSSNECKILPALSGLYQEPIKPSPSNFSYNHQKAVHPVNYLDTLPSRIRGIFKFEAFNKMQAEAFPAIFQRNNNCVISAPTGSGKTVLFEIAILRLYIQGDDINLNNNMKVLYVAPTRALCSERYEDWKTKFAPLNITVGLLTSDTAFSETEMVKKSNVIITTPEKWDLLTRRRFDYVKLFNLVKLILVDEIHILKDKRGATLEVATTRMKRMCNGVRIIALSATVPNIKDISTWLTKSSKEHAQAAETLVFGENYRPVKLQKVVIGLKNSSNNVFQFDFSLNSKMLEVIRQKAPTKPVLVFCPTRKIAFTTANFLASNWGQPLQTNSDLKVEDKEISNLLRKGAACHHAGLSHNDRIAIEKSFIKGKIKFLCSTSTLAVGVNLPAYLVVVKGTKNWNEGTFTEYSELDILQMIGRAGRPQYEKEGIAVIMTEEANKKKYERLVQGSEKLESSLHLNLLGNLAAEVTLGTVTNVETAVEWLSSTFFYTRYCKNPTAYKEVKGLSVVDLDTRLALFCERQLEELMKSEIIKFDSLSQKYKSTVYGDAMSRHYVLFETMKRYVTSPAKLSLRSVFELLCQSSEFQELKLKHAEKRLFKEVSFSTLLKFPTKANISVTELAFHKVFLLIQYELGGLEFPNYKGSFKLFFTFNSEKLRVFKQCGRLIKCLVDTFAGKKDSISLLNALKLGRCVAGKCWEDSPMMLRQLEGIGLTNVRKFLNRNVTTFAQVSSMQASEIEYYLGMKPGSGLKILKDISTIPKYSISCRLISFALADESDGVVVKFSVTVQYHNNTKVTHWDKQFLVTTVVTEISSGELLDFRSIPNGKLDAQKTFQVEAKITRKNQIVRAHVSCNSIATTGAWSALSMKIPDTMFEKIAVKVEQKGALDEGSFFEDEEEEDDSDLDKMMIEFTSKKQSNESRAATSETAKQDPVQNAEQDEGYRRRSNGNFECKHTCKEKSMCRHLCCKEGMLSVPRKRPASKIAGFQMDNLAKPTKHVKLHPEVHQANYDDFSSVNASDEEIVWKLKEIDKRNDDSFLDGLDLRSIADESEQRKFNMPQALYEILSSQEQDLLSDTENLRHYTTNEHGANKTRIPSTEKDVNICYSRSGVLSDGGHRAFDNNSANNTVVEIFSDCENEINVDDNNSLGSLSNSKEQVHRHNELERELVQNDKPHTSPTSISDDEDNTPVEHSFRETKGCNNCILKNNLFDTSGIAVDTSKDETVREMSFQHGPSDKERNETIENSGYGSQLLDILGYNVEF